MKLIVNKEIVNILNYSPLSLPLQFQSLEGADPSRPGELASLRQSMLLLSEEQLGSTASQIIIGMAFLPSSCDPCLMINECGNKFMSSPGDLFDGFNIMVGSQCRASLVIEWATCECDVNTRGK